MPKKQRKSKEEKTAEDYFPVDKSDLEHTIEKKEPQKQESIKKSVEIPTKEIQPIEEIRKGSVEVKYKKLDRKSLEKVEKISKKKSRKKRVKKTAKTPIKYSHPQIKLKKEGYELILTEKPQAALKIASSLGDSTKRNNRGVPYYEVNRDGKEIIVACAVGHLFTLNQNITGSSVPIFDISWAPNFIVRKKDFTKKYYDTLLKLVKNAKSLTVATDYDIEGELIGLNVVRFICNQEDANRMKFSTLTSKELNEAYENKLPNINWGHAIAGETRHYLDWFYGINLSRALMNAIKTTGKFRIMSIGRVQGPTLNLIVEKEKEIQTFQSKPYFQIFIKVENSHTLELKHNKDIFDKSELKKFEDLIGKTVKAETKKTEQILPPNPPFNLTALQTECYKFHGITPSKTLQAAQSLYLGGLISYPRTSSQKLPNSIDYKTILRKLAKEYNVGKLITKERPIEGIKTDPAHPSIHPTGEKQILSGNEEKVYNLIARRFLSLFCDNAIIDNKKVSVTADNLIFNARGSEIRKKAWLEIYPVKLKENEIPDLNGDVNIIDLRTEEKETQPPKRYSPASIITELEKRNLGTKATRSTILETLYDRNYIKEKSIEATSLGMSLISSLEKYSPIIIDEELTRDFEKEMEKIQESKENFKQKEDIVIDKAKKTITKIAEQFGKNEKKIGQELLVANLQLQEQQREENKLNICPVCKKGNLAITYSKKTRRHFIACNAYPNCKTTYSLPPNGVIRKTNKVCESCNFPKLMLLKYGRKPWFFCFNRECETNKKRIEEYKRKIEENK
ncbi:DNA topoisomerase I [Candidatus Pacearchaeota archaeon]|jgi:DNA topoisomerase-1|nr:DNA topoisomerase I [Candidatus Pacearchaeota archaeon]|tara:strand:- start:418 stop:2793 length:2376 start_codon:yes stop_codon:yes gene_type:complete